MSFIDKAKDFAEKNSDKVNAAIDKAGDLIDERTGGKHAEHIDTIQEKTSEFLTGEQKDRPAQ